MKWRQYRRTDDSSPQHTRSRHRRIAVCQWAGLAFAAILLSLGGLGCGFDTDRVGTINKVPDDGDDNNVYVCACDCAVGSRIGSFFINAGDDDVEEFVSDGFMLLDSVDLDFQQSDTRIVGLRFSDFAIPQGANITDARLQFGARTDSIGSIQVVIRGERSGSAAPFSVMNSNLSNRFPMTTSNTVSWSIPSWNAGDRGPAQRTPNLADVLNEVVAEPDWTGASPLVLLIEVISGGGRFEAVSFEEDPILAAELTIEWQDPSSGRFRFNTCMPPSLNPNTPGVAVPSVDALEADCKGRVEDTLSGIASTCGYADSCDCEITPLPSLPGITRYTTYALECNDTCSPVPLDESDGDGDGNPDCSNFDPQNGLTEANATADAGPVCLQEGGPGMVLRSLSREMFGAQSECDLQGEAELLVGDTLKRPAAGGLLRFDGLCQQGQVCDVGLSYSLGVAPVSFDVKWASDPTFLDLGATGATDELQLIGDSGIGLIDPDGSMTSLRGRRGSDDQAFVATNGEGVVLIASPEFSECSFGGSLASTVETEDPEAQGEEPFEFSLELFGELVNQPPVAIAGMSQAVECTSPAGARFVLDASESYDPDGNISVVSWRQGSRTGDEIGFRTKTARVLTIGESQTYVVRAIDSFGQADEDSTTVSVVDTQPPVVMAQIVEVTDGGGDPDEARSEIQFVCQDECDDEPELMARANGVQVERGQLVVFEQQNEFQAEFEDGILYLEGPAFELVATCTDGSGNESLATATPGTPGLSVILPEKSAETPEQGCGLGFEIVAMLGLYAAVRQRRRRWTH